MKGTLLEQYSKLHQQMIEAEQRNSLNRAVHDFSFKFSLIDGLPLNKEINERRTQFLQLHKDFINENWNEFKTLETDTFVNVVPYQIFETSHMTEKERIGEWCKSLSKDDSYGQNMNNKILEEKGFAQKWLNLKIFISDITFNRVAGEIANSSLILMALSSKLNMIPNSIKIFIGECSIGKNETITFDQLTIHSN